jgi:hypothetical protein
VGGEQSNRGLFWFVWFLGMALVFLAAIYLPDRGGLAAVGAAVSHPSTVVASVVRYFEDFGSRPPDVIAALEWVVAEIGKAGAAAATFFAGLAPSSGAGSGRSRPAGPAGGGPLRCPPRGCPPGP